MSREYFSADWSLKDRLSKIRSISGSIFILAMMCQLLISSSKLWNPVGFRKLKFPWIKTWQAGDKTKLNKLSNAIDFIMLVENTYVEQFDEGSSQSLFS